MTTYILRGIDPKFWRRVKSKAALEGVTVKDLILRLLAAWLVLVAALALTACSGDSASPVAASPPVAPPTPTYTLTGVVSIASSSTAIANATVAVIDGPNPGRNAITDGAGRYTIAGLTRAGFNINASAPGYNAVARGVNLTADTTANFSLLPSLAFSRSGSGDTVFDIPTYVSRIRITASFPGNSSNFIVRIASRLVVNELLGRSWGPTTFDGTYTTAGGVTEITNSSSVAWAFAEVR